MDNDNSTQKRMIESSPEEATQAAATRLANQTAKRAASATLPRDQQDQETNLLSPAADAESTRLANPRIRPSPDQALPPTSQALPSTDQTLQSAKTQALDRQAAKTTAINPDLKVVRQTGGSGPFAHLDRRVAERYQGKTVLKERFVLLETLGAGGMGNVYLAKDLLREEMEDSNPHIAIKVLNDECRRLPGALQSLQREAKKAQTLSHPNIVTVYDFDRDGETAFITMEYIEGESLKDHLRGAKSMPHEKAMYVIERVARGLAYAHQQGFAHADIKPANIFLAKNGAVKILDFGIAKAFTEATKEKRSLADDLTEGALTPAYASLEMLQGKTALPGDDVYSLACMAYEMIRGRHPFIGTDGLPMPADIARAQGAKLDPIVGIPRRHMRALRRGLEFEREKRFPDAGQFIDAIKRRNLKKDLGLLALTASITGAAIFATSTALDQVVPSVTSLKPELASVASAIVEGDEFLNGQDIDLAHRLYSQAWELANDLTTNDVVEREKAHAILADRMIQVSDILIERAQAPDIDEYQLRELFVALEFLAKDEIAGNERRIEAAMARIEKRLKTD